MNRSPLSRSNGKARPAIKLKPKKCSASKGGCGEEFTPVRSMQKACGIVCAHAMVRVAKQREAAKAMADDRRKTRAQMDGMKTIGALEGECRKIIQKIARIRDRNDGCISCHMGPSYGGQWHGSHYRAHGGCSSLQMHLWNVHKACAQCNLFKSGNREGYIQGLLKKPGYGRERLEWLDNQPKSRRFDRDYLLRFKAVMGKRMRRLERLT